jgi:hypothetical protein
LIVVETVSPDDATFDRFPFYWRQVEEILTVDRHNGWLAGVWGRVMSVVAPKARVVSLNGSELTAEGIPQQFSLQSCNEPLLSDILWPEITGNRVVSSERCRERVIALVPAPYCESP